MKILSTEYKTKNYEGNQIVIASNGIDDDIEMLRRQCVSVMNRVQGIKDEGTCTIGGGIMMNFFCDGKRKPNTLKLVADPFQGNVSSWKALEPVLDYLNKYYPQLNCFYQEGKMD